MERVVQLVLWVLPVDGDHSAVGDGVGVISVPFSSGNTWAALSRFPLCTSEAAALSNAPTLVVVLVGPEWFPPGVAKGYCAKLPRTPPSTAAKRKVTVWLMALRSSRA